MEYIIDRLKILPGFEKSLAGLAGALTEILKETLDLLEWVGRASELSDSSHIEIASIKPHPQNDRWGHWVLLIELVRDSWLALKRANLPAAKGIVGRWSDIRFPIFRRLEAFAHTSSDLCLPSEAIAFLAQDDGWWLWSRETKREYLQLIMVSWPKLELMDRERLSSRILAGPPRHMFTDEISNEEWTRRRERLVWLRLAKLDSVDHGLTTPAQDELQRLTDTYQWALADDESDEFTSWHYSGPMAGLDTSAYGKRLPTRKELVELLQLGQQHEKESVWRTVVDRTPRRALLALLELSLVPEPDIAAPFSILMQSYRPRTSCGRALKLTNELLRSSDLAPGLPAAAIFLRSLAEDLPESAEPAFWQLWDTLAIGVGNLDPQEEEDVADLGLNSPGGQLVDVLFERLSKLAIQAGHGLPLGFAHRLEVMLRVPLGTGTIARITSRLRYLWAVDRDWTHQHVLPILTTEHRPFAAEAWAGYLSNANIDSVLLDRLKGGLIEACSRRTELGRWCDSACTIFAAASILLPGLYSDKDTSRALRAMDDEGRAAVALQMRLQLESANEKAGGLWKDRIGPWIRTWPQVGVLTSPRVSRELAVAAVRAREAFEDAVETVLLFLRRETNEGYDNAWVRWGLAKTEHPDNYPRATLKLLSASVPFSEAWPGHEFREVLERLLKADQSLGAHPDYRRLSEYLERHGE